MKEGVFYLPVFIEVNGYASVAFYAGNGINGYFACHMFVYGLWFIVYGWCACVYVGVGCEIFG
jgi:hypothetical protein